MSTEIKTYVVDRTGWDSGPWDGEPDRAEWQHKGLTCLVLRQKPGFLCGYVAVPPSHPAHGVDYDKLSDVDPNLTYSGECSGHICHVPAPGEPDNVFWFGFDCNHHGDTCPGNEALERKMGWGPMPGSYPIYRDLEWVRNRVCVLAEKLAAMPRAGQ